VCHRIFSRAVSTVDELLSLAAALSSTKTKIIHQKICHQLPA
jgi:hypothetical protein